MLIKRLRLPALQESYGFDQHFITLIYMKVLRVLRFVCFGENNRKDGHESKNI